MTPLILLVLLAFFLVLALAFTVWAALTVGEYAKRAESSAARRGEGAAPKRGRQGGAKEAREPKPWERVPDPPVKERRRDAARGQPRHEEGTRGQAREGGLAVQGGLWDRQPAPAKGQPLPQPAAKPSLLDWRAVKPAEPAAQATEQASGRAVVTPRKPDTDAFERFLESEKRRE